MKNETTTPSGAPADSIQAGVIQIWKELLAVDEVGPGDNFLLMGGESLLAMQASARLSDTFGLEVPIRSILVGTVAEIVREIASSLKEGTK